LKNPHKASSKRKREGQGPDHPHTAAAANQAEKKREITKNNNHNNSQSGRPTPSTKREGGDRRTDDLLDGELLLVLLEAVELLTQLGNLSYNNNKNLIILQLRARENAEHKALSEKQTNRRKAIKPSNTGKEHQYGANSAKNS